MEALDEAAEMTHDQAAAVPATAQDLLKLAKDLIADNLLSEAQQSVLESSPYDFLRELVTGRVDIINTAHPAFALATECCQQIVKGYFASLQAKAREGEKFDEDRLERALIQAQVKAIEKIQDLIEGCNDADTLLKLVQELKK